MLFLKKPTPTVRITCSFEVEYKVTVLKES